MNSSDVDLKRETFTHWLFPLFIFTFNIIGIFGNFNILFATANHKRLRTKNGLLVATLSLIHVLCLLSEWVNAWMEYNQITVHRSTCFKLIQPYMLLVTWQASMYFVLSIDFLIAITVPLRHRTWNTVPYVIMMNIPPALFSLLLFGVAHFYLDDAVIPFCNPPLAWPEMISVVWSVSSLICTCGALLVFYLAYHIYKKRDKKMRGSATNRKGTMLDSYKFVRALSAMVIISGTSWICLVVYINAILLIDLPKETKQRVQSYGIFMALIVYSQDSYICYWRCEVYRKILQKQMNKLFRRTIFPEDGVQSGSSQKKVLAQMEQS